MLETVREFAGELLESASEAPRTRDRHAAWSVALAERGFTALVRSRSVDPSWLARLEAERGNLGTALAWLEGRGRGKEFPQLAGALGPFWFFHSHLAEGRHWLERALHGTSPAVPQCRARVLVGLGVLLQILGEPDRAVALVEEGMSLWEATGEVELATQALLILGWMAVKAGDYASAAAQLDRAGDRFRSMGADWWIAKALYHQGEAALGHGALEHAHALFAEALGRYHDLDDPWGMASSLHGLGAVASDRGDFVTAARLFQDALAPWRAVGTTEGLVTWVAGVAALAGSCEQSAPAARLFGAASVLGQALGLTFGLPERARFVQAEAVTRAALGEAAFVVETATGQAMTAEHAVAEAASVLDTAAAGPPRWVPQNSGFGPSLTRREQQVLRHLATGATDREIAAELSISPRTVGVHVSHLLAKLGVETRRAARARALQECLV
jgi:non-specific serine/threonine protein kinase